MGNGITCACCSAQSYTVFCDMEWPESEHRFCSDCFELYHVAKRAMPDQTLEHVLSAAMLLHLFRDLGDRDKDQLQRLLGLIRNGNQRAARLTKMAAAGQIGLAQLLAAI